MNDTVKSENAPQPYGDYTASKNFLHRLHVDVIEGHNPGGIPKENFEVNCGNNESGVVYDKSGNEYVGEFKNGKRHGQGIYTMSDGSKYAGQWKDSLPKVEGI